LKYTDHKTPLNTEIKNGKIIFHLQYIYLLNLNSLKMESSLVFNP